MTSSYSSVAAWRRVLRTNITDKQRLVEYLELNPQLAQRVVPTRHFPLHLPLRLAQKMNKGTLDDPLLRQYVPLQEEHVLNEGFSKDPVGDELSCVTERFLHKYKGRALLLCTGACAMHCRYCFRQHYDYPASHPFDKELECISEDPSLREIILSGGDPLALNNESLQQLIHRLSCMKHIRRLRFHTRFPIGIPERVDSAFLGILSTAKQAVYFVIHCNHPKELDDEVLQALDSVRRAGATLLCQSVLLRGVNDDEETLEELCFKLVDHHIQPYYLHQLDRAQGTAHFEVSAEKGIQLIHRLRGKLPGYAVPQFVRESSGEPSKTPLLSFCHS